MSELKVNIESLDKSINDYLTNYIENIEDDIVDLTNDITKQAINELKLVSPKGARKKYAEGWAKQVEKKALKNRRYTIKIHNKTDYNLTHLLEFGHATKNGKRTKAIPHIRPVEQKYNKLYEQGIKDLIRRSAK